MINNIFSDGLLNGNVPFAALNRKKNVKNVKKQKSINTNLSRNIKNPTQSPQTTRAPTVTTQRAPTVTTPRVPPVTTSNNTLENFAESSTSISGSTSSTITKNNNNCRKNKCDKNFIINIIIIGLIIYALYLLFFNSSNKNFSEIDYRDMTLGGLIPKLARRKIHVMYKKHM